MDGVRFDLLPGRALRAVVFDCDGVLVDSEPVANRVMSELLAEHGIDIAPAECMRMFVGLTIEAEARVIRDRFGVDLADVLSRELNPRTIAAFERELRAVEGIHAMLASLRVPVAVASSSRPERVAASLQLTGLDAAFGRHVYTVSQVERPKPAPDVYLLAASELCIPASQCLVFEDSVTGTQAAVAAGMPTVGFIGGGHRSEADRAALLRAGALQVISRWSEWTADFCS